VNKKEQIELYPYQKDIIEKLKKLDKPIFIQMPKRLRFPYEEKIRGLQNPLNPER
jgi:hypothetical protein